METFNPSKKKHHNWSFVVSLRTARSTGKKWGEWLTVCLYEIPLKALWTIHLGPAQQPCDSFPPSSTTALMRLPTSHLASSRGFLGTFSLFGHFYVRAWPGAALPPLGIPQVWSNVGRGSSSANWSGMYQPKRKKEEVEVGSSQGNTALHCSPTFTFHSSPLSVLESHPSTKHKLSVPSVWLFFHSFLPLLLRLLHNHLTWHFPTAKDDVLTENFNASSVRCQWEENEVGKRINYRQAACGFTTGF